MKCLNTCREAGKAARDELKKKIAVYQEGVAICKQEVEQAKVGLAKDKEELSKLKSEEKVLKVQFEQLKGLVFPNLVVSWQNNLNLVVMISLNLSLPLKRSCWLLHIYIIFCSYCIQ